MLTYSSLSSHNQLKNLHKPNINLPTSDAIQQCDGYYCYGIQNQNLGFFERPSVAETWVFGALTGGFQGPLSRWL